ncbi:hypothetical protein [Candidatus Nitrososphaera evergladensis]|nr:hypothetical protein [Candidatus Nitrososphaera evergladensis]
MTSSKKKQQDNIRGGHPGLPSPHIMSASSAMNVNRIITSVEGGIYARFY